MAQGFRARGIGTAVTTRGRVVITDGRTIQRPGSVGTTGRLRVQWHLGTGRGEPIPLTDAHGAESLTRLTLHPHDGGLADRKDARPAALAAVVDQSADLVVRCGGNALRGEAPTGTPWAPLEAVRTLPDGTPGDWVGQRPVGQTHPPFRLRVVAIRKSPTATE